MHKAVYFHTLQGFCDILQPYRNRWHLTALTLQSLAVFSGDTKMVNGDIFSPSWKTLILHIFQVNSIRFS